MNFEETVAQIVHYFELVNRQRACMREAREALAKGARARDARAEKLLDQDDDIPDALSAAAAYLPQENIADAWEEGRPAPTKPIDAERLASKIAATVKARALAYFTCVAEQHQAIREADALIWGARELGASAAKIMDKLDAHASQFDPGQEVLLNAFADAPFEILKGTASACDPDSVLDWVVDPDQSLAPVAVQKAADATWLYVTKG